MKLPDWRGRTVVCIASGPSVTAADCDLVRAAGAPVVVTNTTFRLVPWADVLYAYDRQWWNAYIAEVRATFPGRKFCQTQAQIRKDIECARLSLKFAAFGNSGACAVALAIAFGAPRVVMVGYDCSTANGSHHHGDHPATLRNCDTLQRWPIQFERLANWARRRAVVVNASRETALSCFPRAKLEDALLDGAADVGRQDGGRVGVGAQHVAVGG